MYEHLNDEELVALARGGETEAIDCIMKRYRHNVLAVARSYFLSGGDTEDLIQEGMLGVFRAILTFNPEKSNFKSYSYLCVKSAILTLIKKSTREKNKPLNNYISLSGGMENDNDKTDIVLDVQYDPERSYINKESEVELLEEIKNALSKYEHKILIYYLQGYSYDEISQKAGKDVKSIDNALQRIRKKLSSKVEMRS